jgi:hypothetical protein
MELEAFYLYLGGDWFESLSEGTPILDFLSPSKQMSGQHPKIRSQLLAS